MDVGFVESSPSRKACSSDFFPGPQAVKSASMTPIIIILIAIKLCVFKVKNSALAAKMLPVCFITFWAVPSLVSIL